MSATVARRIVLITPAARGELGALKQAGFTGYLIKPVRATSLAAQLTGHAGDFDRGIAEADAPAAAVAANPPAAGLAVLVAEDNEINALLTDALLRRLGHRPTVVSNGDAAVDAWSAARAADQPFDLVLMDLYMPGRDGIAATQAIRAQESQESGEDGRHTPIIALTANTADDDREACRAAGFDAFLAKPVDRERLSAVLKDLQGRKSLAA